MPASLAQQAGAYSIGARPAALFASLMLYVFSARIVHLDKNGRDESGAHMSGVRRKKKRDANYIAVSLLITSLSDDHARADTDGSRRNHLSVVSLDLLPSL